LRQLKDGAFVKLEYTPKTSVDQGFKEKKLVCAFCLTKSKDFNATFRGITIEFKFQTVLGMCCGFGSARRSGQRRKLD